MKKTKQFLSVLLCVVLLSSVFTVGSQAANKSEVTLNKKKLTLNIVKNGSKTDYGNSTLKIKKQKGVKLKSVKYKSTAKNVATVTKAGKVTAKKSGTAKIQATVKYLYKNKLKKTTLSCKVKVKNITNPVYLNKTEVELKMTQNGNIKYSDTESLSVKKASGVTVKKVTYKSSDTEIATVSSSGLITPLKMGAADITASVKYSYAKKAYTKDLTCKVKVTYVYKNIINELKLKRNTLATFVGNAEGINPCYRTTAKLDPEFYLWDCLKVSADDPSVVELGSDGLIVGKKEGTTTVTVQTTDGSNLTEKAVVKVYKTREDIPVNDDLYERERAEFLPKLVEGWDEETKKRYTDENGNIRWSLFSEGDIEYKKNKAKLLDEFRNIEKQPDNTSEDVLASMLSTAKQLKEGKGDKEFFEIIGNKLVKKILAVKTTDELLEVCGDLGHDGISTLFDSTTFYRKFINQQLEMDIEEGIVPVPDEEVKVGYEFYPILYTPRAFNSSLTDESKRKDVLEYITKIFSLAGINDEKVYEDTLKISLDIAGVEEDPFDFDSLDEDSLMGAPATKVKYSDVDNKYPNLKIKDYFKKIGFDLKDDTLVFFAEDNVLKRMNEYMKSEENLDMLKGYTALVVLQSLNFYTRTGIELEYRLSNIDNPEELTEEKIKEYIDQRQEYFLDAIEYEIPWDVDQVYTKRYYSKTYKQEFEKLVDDFVGEYETAISESWMSDKAKKNMLKKLSKTKFNNLYPNEEEYKLLTVRDDMVTAQEGGNFADNLIVLQKNKADLMRLTIGKESGSYTWWAPSRSIDILTFAPWTNNASFDWVRNQAFFAHVGISAFFKSNPDNNEDTDVRNIAYMAGTIGHEIGHGYDNLGSCFNGDGNIENLWTDEDKESYNKKVDKLADFYEHSMAYPDFENNTARYQDGKNVVGEAMADLGGTEIALRILKKKYPNDDNKIRQFYKHTAQMWLNTSVDGISGDILDVRINNEHPAYRLRTNNVASMMDEFYRVFEVKESDAMYVNPEDRVVLWPESNK